MPQLNFPASPNHLQEYTSGTLTFVYDSDAGKWNRSIPTYFLRSDENDTMNGSLTIAGGTPLVFEGATANDFETSFVITDPTQDNTITFLDATGTVVLDTSTQTLTNKTITAPAISNPVITGAIDEEVYAWDSTTGTVTTEMDPANGTIQTVTLTGNITSLTDNFAEGEAITLMVDDGTASTITWPTTTWVNNGGSAPTLADSALTIIAFWKVSTTLYGALVGDGS
jgi:hypothetical protein